MAEGSSKSSDLYRGFEAYRTVQDDDYKQVLLSGVVVPDTNVLLNLYRYIPEARADLMAVLKKLGSRLWVPHQVLAEFWRNRNSAITDPKTSSEAAAEALTAQLDQAQRAVRTWGNRAAAPSDQVDHLVESLDSAFQSVVEAVTSSVDEEELQKRRNTRDDVVLRDLEPIVQGRAGSPLDDDAYLAAVAEGKRRGQEGIPPGFADRSKPEERAVGDYLIWEQVMRHAEAVQRDVLFVTGDVKNDWWRLDQGRAQGPRFELVNELQQRAGVALYMVRPESLLRLGEQFLKVTVREESLRDAARIGSVFDGGDGWSSEALEVALARLDQRGVVQANAIRAAVRRGGFVPRHVVYQLGNYSDDRTLRGFTRPANAVSQELRNEGLIPASAPNILEAVYDPAYSYVQASGFNVPLGLAVDARGRDETESRTQEPQAPASVATEELVTITFRDRNGNLHAVEVAASIAKLLSDRLYNTPDRDQ